MKSERKKRIEKEEKGRGPKTEKNKERSEATVQKPPKGHKARKRCRRKWK